MKRFILAVMATGCLITGCSKTVTYTENSMKNRSESDQIINNKKETVTETAVASDSDVVPSNDSGRSGEAAEVKEVVEEKVENVAITDDAKKQEIIDGMMAKIVEPFDDYSVDASSSVEIIILDKDTNNKSTRYIADSIAQKKMSREASYSKVDLQSSVAGVKSYIHSMNYLIDTGERTLSYFKSYDEGIKDVKPEWRGAVVARDLETEERTLKNIADNLSFDAVKVGKEKLDGTERYTVTCFYNLYNAMELIGVPSNIHNVFTDNSANYKATIKLYLDESDYSVVRYDISANKALEAYYNAVYNTVPETEAKAAETAESIEETTAAVKNNKKNTEETTQAETEAENVGGTTRPNINAEVIRCKGVFNIDTKSKVKIEVDPEVKDMIADDGQRKLEELSRTTGDDTLGLNVDSSFGVGAGKVNDDDEQSESTETKVEESKSEESNAKAEAKVEETKAEKEDKQKETTASSVEDNKASGKKVLKPRK